MPEPAPYPSQPLLEGRDYYMDGPYLVFTREYHLRRGSCCHSGCRHCPYQNTNTGPTQNQNPPNLNQ